MCELEVHVVGVLGLANLRRETARNTMQSPTGYWGPGPGAEPPDSL